MRTLSTLAVALWAGLTAAGAEGGDGQSLIVRVYNYAGVSDKTLSSAELTAQHIFRKAGVETEWIDCPKDRGEEARYPGCKRPASEADVIVSILSNATKGYDVREMVFGFALSSIDGGLPRHAYVFFRRVEQAVRKSERPMLDTLLAYVMVHETGHLLLGPAMHQNRGIMRPQWAPNELSEMERGTLAFPPEQARLLRVNARERAKLAVVDWKQALVRSDKPPEQ